MAKWVVRRMDGEGRGTAGVKSLWERNRAKNGPWVARISEP
jgi:hypothetical protein